MGKEKKEKEENGNRKEKEGKEKNKEKSLKEGKNIHCRGWSMKKKFHDFFAIVLLIF